MYDAPTLSIGGGRVSCRSARRRPTHEGSQVERLRLLQLRLLLLQLDLLLCLRLLRVLLAPPVLRAQRRVVLTRSVTFCGKYAASPPSRSGRRIVT